jgi:hypothetical protein
MCGQILALRAPKGRSDPPSTGCLYERLGSMMRAPPSHSSMVPRGAANLTLRPNESCKDTCHTPDAHTCTLITAPPHHKHKHNRNHAPPHTRPHHTTMRTNASARIAPQHKTKTHTHTHTHTRTHRHTYTEHKRKRAPTNTGTHTHT